MSRAFVKEDAGAEPLLRTWGGALPAGVPNLATPWSVLRLEEELAAMRLERRKLADETSGVAIARVATLDAEIRALEQYLPTLQIVAPPAAPDRAAFGTRVHIEGPAGERTVDLVGIDEASPADGRVSFVAPLGRALLGAQPGDTVTVRTPHGDEDWEVVSVAPARQSSPLS
jgi:transcription elongation factor GreB